MVSRRAALAAAAVATVGVVAVAIAVGRRKPGGGNGGPAVTLSPSVTSANPGATVSFSGSVNDSMGNGIPGVQVDLYINGALVTPIVYKDPTNADPLFGPVGVYVVGYVFQSAGSYSIYTQAEGVQSPVVSVTISQAVLNTFVLAVVTASGTCDMSFTGKQAQACSLAQSMIGKYEDSFVFGCYHEVVTSVTVYLGPNVVCQF